MLNSHGTKEGEKKNHNLLQNRENIIKLLLNELKRRLKKCFSAKLIERISRESNRKVKL